MKFIIVPNEQAAIDAKHFDWLLQHGGVSLCRSIASYPSEEACRTAIAHARRAMSAARFAKVEVLP